MTRPIRLLLACAGLQAAVGWAASAHVHGLGQLDIAVDGGRVDVFLVAPRGDLVTDGDPTPAELAQRLGESGLTFLGSSCALVNAQGSVDVIEAEADAREDHHGDDEHDEERHDEDGHDREGASDSHAGHSDYRFEWQYRCDTVPASLQVELFGQTSLERLNVQAVSRAGALGATLTPETPTLRLP